MANAPGEQWRPIPDWDGLYDVSDHGRVRSVPREIRYPTHSQWMPGKILTLVTTHTGGSQGAFVATCRTPVVE